MSSNPSRKLCLYAAGDVEYKFEVHAQASEVTLDYQHPVNVTGTLKVGTISDVEAAIGTINADIASAGTALNTLGTTLGGDITDVSVDLLTETGARVSADSTERTQRIAADDALTTNLASEIADRQAAVTAEIGDREAADTTLTNAIAAEKKRIDDFLSAESINATHLSNLLAAYAGESTSLTDRVTLIETTLSTLAARVDSIAGV